MVAFLILCYSRPIGETPWEKRSSAKDATFAELILTVLYHNPVKLHLKAPPDFSFLECVNSHGWKSLLPFSWDAESGTLSRVELCAGFEVTELNISSAGDMIVVDADLVPIRLSKVTAYFRSCPVASTNSFKI